MATSDEIVLTVAKNGRLLVPSKIRMERLPASQIDQKSILYIAEGPYKGITINKQVNDIRNRLNPEVRLAFTCFILQKGNMTKEIKEKRQLCFWFKRNINARQRVETAQKFFSELLDPETFPQDMTLFIKKTVVMLQSYIDIICVDINVDRTDVVVQDVAVEEAYRVCLAPTLMESYGNSAEMSDDEEIDVMRNFVTVLTPDKYDYQFVPEIPVSKKHFLNFKVKTAGNAHVCLSAVYGNLDQKTVEITIGGKDNTRSWICENAEGAKRAEAITKGILSGSESRDFWISWKNGLIEVGEGNIKGRGRFMYWRVPEKKQFRINCLAVSTNKTGNGEWEFVDLIYPEKSKAERRAKARASLLWLAKKQRMLNVLEDAYPDSMPTSELLRLAKIKTTDMMTAVIMLREMQKKELIKEVSMGDWMRMPGGLIGGKAATKKDRHEVKMVTRMPILTGREQPTIAVITSMYCEKQAVDSMISDKVTYVRYIKQGDSSVYTLGKIGKHLVLSTKLSRIGGTQAANISAENAITRLLGTFNRVEHVILVGVAGGVPHFRDYFQHVRLGDVVVSVPQNQNDPSYIFCEKMEFDSLGQISFSTKTWQPKSKLMHDVTRKLKDQEARQNLSPWEKYIDEGKESLHGEESSFYRPSSKTDKIVRTNENGEVLYYEHPAPPQGHIHKDNVPNIRLGSVGSGKFISRNEMLREQFSDVCGVIAFDYEFDSILRSLEGNRNDSFVLIRGIADYSDGSMMKEWQPYAALSAAAFMKALVVAL